MLISPTNLSKASLSWSLSICILASAFLGFGHTSLSLNVSSIINLIQPVICSYSIQGSLAQFGYCANCHCDVDHFCFKSTDHNQFFIPSRSAKICNMMLWYIPSAEAIPMGSCINCTVAKRGLKVQCFALSVFGQTCQNPLIYNPK